MKIFLNGRFLSQNVTGVQRFAMEIIKAIDNELEHQRSFGDGVYLIVPHDTPVKLQLNHIEIVRTKTKLKGHAWEQLILPIATRNHLLVNLCNTAPVLKTNQIVTIHDAAVYSNPKNFSFAFRTWYRFLFSVITKTCRKLTTVSRFSAKELSAYCGVKQDKIMVITAGKEHVLDTEPDCNILMKNDLMGKKYILAVSSNNPNKNFISIVKAFEHLKDIDDLSLVIAGSRNNRIFQEAEGLGRANVKQLGYVDDRELRALYDHALCFVFPSFYEGFGLPPLEAMACGCPVVLSDASCLPEIFQDAALYCDPHQPKEIADQILKLYESDEVREAYKQRGLVHSGKYEWSRGAAQLLSLMNGTKSE
jgi:glycosyltransferase involved in cell wall biosynthesis